MSRCTIYHCEGIELMFIIALSPILWLVLALSILKMPGYKACPIALIHFLAGGGAQFRIWRRSRQPWLSWRNCFGLLFDSAGHSGGYFLRIIFLSIQKEWTPSSSCLAVSSDRRVLILLIGWGFGGFLEGMAGSTAIAIPAGMLAGLGISPVLAASVCLVANSVPTAYGSIGIPLVTLGSVTGIDAAILARYTCPAAGAAHPALSLYYGSSDRAFAAGAPGSMAGRPGFRTGLFAAGILVASLMGPDLAVVAGSIGGYGGYCHYRTAVSCGCSRISYGENLQTASSAVSFQQRALCLFCRFC